MTTRAAAIQRQVARALLVCGLALGVNSGSAHAAGCPVDGPTSVNPSQSFTMCGVLGNGYSYEWHGSGFATSATSRCVTVSGLSAGTYEYQLIVRSGGLEIDRCTHTVAVGTGAFGNLTSVISGPTSIAYGSSTDLCAPQSTRHSYSWTGPAGFTGSTPCVTVSRSGTYTLSIVNDVTGYTRECSHTITVGGTESPVCTIDGPDVIARGGTAQLCAPVSSDALYRWSGPAGFSSSSHCVAVRTAGTYYLTLRSRSTGAEDQCSRTLDAVDATTEGCAISGPASLASGTPADLCSQSFGNSSYSWTGPGSFRSSVRCIRVTVPGVYRVAIRDLSTGSVRTCSFTLGDVNGVNDGADDADLVASDNCPRALAFWQQQCRRAADGRRLTSDFVADDLLSIARRVDELSAYFNWSDDVAGFCAALNPVRPLTNRKQAIRHYAALLANVAAGELGITARNGDAVSLDPETSGSFGTANTISELIVVAERRLSSGRGSFLTLSQQLNAINRGRGIGPVCP
jgi:hypothetical protein